MFDYVTTERADYIITCILIEFPYFGFACLHL